jgi:hypothetical protein
LLCSSAAAPLQKSSYYFIVILIDNKSKIWYVLFCWKFLGDERMPLDAVKSVGKVCKKCEKSVQIVGNRQPGRESVPGTRSVDGWMESGLGTRGTRPDSHNEE